MREDEFLQAVHFNCLLKEGGAVNQSVAIVLPLTTVDKNRYYNEHSKCILRGLRN